MKMGIWAFGAIFAMIILAGIVAAEDAGVTCPPNNPSCACSDGTAYFGCSQTQPGYACILQGNKHVLVNMMGPDSISRYKSQCSCDKYPGYSLVSGSCVKTTCSDGSNTIQNLVCASGKPKQCVNGNLIDNSSACGCPAGYNPNPNGKTCDQRIGCRWNTYTCPSGRECKFTASSNTDDGTCVSKSGCMNNNPMCNPISETCDTSTDPNGVCIARQGCQYQNPVCDGNHVCNTVTGKCDAVDTGAGVPTIPLPVIPTPTVNGTNSSAGKTASPLGSMSCCCLPGAGAAAMVGLASYQRMRKKEGE